MASILHGLHVLHPVAWSDQRLLVSLQMGVADANVLMLAKLVLF